MAKSVSFNYKLLQDGKIRAAAQENAKQIHSMLAKTGQTLVEIGRRLQAMHEAMGSAVFREWVLCEFQWQQSTASNYMRSALVFGEQENLSLFQPAAIIALSRRNIPQTLIDEALRRAHGGEPVTFSWLKHRLRAFNIPQRADAAQPRCAVQVRAGAAPSMQTMRFILDQWKECLPKTVQEISPDELEELEARIEELMQQLRSAKLPPRPARRPSPRRTAAVA